MFGYQLVNRFPSPGYEIWEVCRKHYLSTGMKLRWMEEGTMKWLPRKLRGWALKAVSDLPRVYWRSTPGKQAWTLTEKLYQFDIQLSDNPPFMSETTICLLEGNRQVRRKSLKTVIMWIKKRDSIVLKCM